MTRPTKIIWLGRIFKPRKTIILLYSLFSTKFPQYRAHDFYLATESYGGHYGPQLAKEIVDRNAQLDANDVNKITLKALLIGNPYNDFFQQNTLEMI